MCHGFANQSIWHVQEHLVAGLEEPQLEPCTRACRVFEIKNAKGGLRGQRNLEIKEHSTSVCSRAREHQGRGRRLGPLIQAACTPRNRFSSVSLSESAVKHLVADERTQLDSTSAGDLIGLLGAVQSNHPRAAPGVPTGGAETVPGLRFSMVAGKFPRGLRRQQCQAVGPGWTQREPARGSEIGLRRAHTV